MANTERRRIDDSVEFDPVRGSVGFFAASAKRR